MSDKRDNEWCPEPWRASGDVVLSADGSCVVESPWTCYEDDLRRIVAAVNACAGIPTEALESGALREALEAADRCSRIGLSEREWVAGVARDLRTELRRLGMLP